ncbi:MAG: Holliday junction branch migration protein RuvA [Candidatus Gribaldobacteria bacterium]|nr:Holliday junction branch migration protein RuvA [Candidatus Gribaldobacteria bacterium]
MIAYLKGKIILKKDSYVIVEVGGVGYETHISEPAFQKLPNLGDLVELFCHMDVNERGIKLFGFLTFEEMEFFKIVRNIQGVGPRAALEISGIGPLEKIQAEIEKGNLKFLDGISGIGPKKASKVILELSGQIRTAKSLAKNTKESLEKDEAFLALVNLGFPKGAVSEALTQLPKGIIDTQERITQALAILGK